MCVGFRRLSASSNPRLICTGPASPGESFPSPARGMHPRGRDASPVVSSHTSMALRANDNARRVQSAPARARRRAAFLGEPRERIPRPPRQLRNLAPGSGPVARVLLLVTLTQVRKVTVKRLGCTEAGKVELVELRVCRGTVEGDAACLRHRTRHPDTRRQEQTGGANGEEDVVVPPVVTVRAKDDV